ncbi:NADP-dependent malic enzyme [Halomarina litorea]|uniref:NADP-dependent malic enzyme n=1 Tax=Halomarina litorea TaxID=2961595 RepID=UPI0020C52D3A|nr:NADP-dependent malic enzyme [Halomarina sp. BCD28]
MSLDDDALEYHRRDPPGKIEISTTKPTNTQRDLSLAYSPGVAAPCREIADDPDEAYTYTAKGNMVGVVSNGSAVLGLGDIGAQASKPVMEGKGVLFKRFADIDVFDIELDEDDPDRLVEAIKMMEPTFGGINLEDIKAPECFEIEERLREEMSIPVFHDDQHGTAIITGAALLNAADIAGKEIEDLTVAFSGAGAAATATANFYVSLGVPPENIAMCDIDGVLTTDRAEAGDLTPQTEPFAVDTPEDAGLSDIIEGRDVFVGLSVGGIVSQEMVRSMADDPIIFAMANPDPEITYPEAKDAREDDVIVATGRSDYPNQVNNVLCFPFLFRGALDVRATEINEAMTVAAAEALADLARQDVPDAVRKAYGDQPLQFGPDYIIPKPVDQRVLFEVAGAVAEAAMESGAARRELDLTAYREQLEARLGKSREMMRVVLNKAKSDPKRVVLAEGDDEKMIRAAVQMHEERIAEPILVGDRRDIERTIDRLDLGVFPTVVDPDEQSLAPYADRLHELRKRKGITRGEASELIEDGNYLGSVMVEMGDADAMLTGLTHHYPTALRPPLQVVGTASDTDYAAGVYMLTFKNRVVFCADATVNQDPDENALAEVARHAAGVARRFDVDPQVALLSYSDFGSVDNEGTRKPRRAAQLLRSDPDVDFPVDGEMQADTAVVEEMLNGTYEFCDLDEPANVLVFPNLEAGNIGYKLLQRLGGADATGPMLAGMDKPVHVLQRGDEVKDIVNLAGVAVVDAQERE